MKKIRFLSLIAVIISMLASFMVFPVAAADVSATPTSAAVQINSAPVAFEAYNINGNNYFKLRDVAYALMTTGKHFSVAFDSASNTIWLSTLELYIPAGGELTSSGNTKAVKAVNTTSTVYLNGNKISFTAYNINGNNYFKLRDIGSALNFSVVYNQAYNTIVIDTTQKYFFTEIKNLLPDADVRDKKIYYNKTSTGSIIITENDDNYYTVEATNLSSDSDYDALKKIYSAFVSDPATLLDTAKKSAIEGRKDLTMDGKKVICISSSGQITVDFKW